MRSNSHHSRIIPKQALGNFEQSKPFTLSKEGLKVGIPASAREVRGPEDSGRKW